MPQFEQGFPVYVRIVKGVAGDDFARPVFVARSESRVVVVYELKAPVELVILAYITDVLDIRDASVSAAVESGILLPVYPCRG